MALLDLLARWWRSLGRAPVPERQRSALGGSARSQEPTREDPESSSDPESDPESAGRDLDDPVVMPIEDAIDLHHFSPRDISSVVVEYLHEAQKAGFRDVRVIHGKGKGVQRRRVQILLGRHPAVEAFRSDGLGSTLVRLRSR